MSKGKRVSLNQCINYRHPPIMTHYIIPTPNAYDVISLGYTNYEQWQIKERAIIIAKP